MCAFDIKEKLIHFTLLFPHIKLVNLIIELIPKNIQFYVVTV